MHFRVIGNIFITMYIILNFVMCSIIIKVSFCLCVYLIGCVTFKHLTLIKWKDDRGEEQLFYLRENIAHEWRTIGELLGLSYSKIESLAEKYRDQPKECCRAVLGLWLENPPKDYPTTWQGLVDLLRHSKLSGVAAQLRHVVSKATDL